jgi:hypothetical protein
LKSSQVLAPSFGEMRTGTGFRHWKRVDGSKYAHCLQQWSAALHFGHCPAKSVPAGNVAEQL